MPRKLNSRYTDWFETTFGVRQGDSLSPTLFSIFINDLVKELNELSLGIDINGRNICSLMYADDIVIFSNTEQNLQSILDHADNWCKRWRVTINIQKSKVVHFRNVRRQRSNFEFKMGNTVLEYTPSYKYLGVIFDENLKFDINSEVLASSGGRALGSIIAKYKLNKCMGHKTYTKLYESGVVPILDYCSGVWGFGNFSKPDMVQNRAMRVFLGVHQFAPILALRGDMGWHTCRIRWYINILRLWNRLVKLPDYRLTKHVFLWDREIVSNNSWSGKIKTLFTTIGLENCFNNMEPCNIKIATEKLFERDIIDWRNSIQLKPKLRLYKTHKENYLPEKYVTLNLIPFERSLMAQFRLGILPLHIETGRFRNIRAENRVCTICNSGLVEDEIHFLFNCPAYNLSRNLFLNDINQNSIEFMRKDVSEKLTFLMENYPRQTSKFIVRCFNLRRRLLYNDNL